MSSIEWTLNEYNTIRISECDLEVRNSLTGHIIIFFPHQEHAMLINSPPHHIPKKQMIRIIASAKRLAQKMDLNID